MVMATEEEGVVGPVGGVALFRAHLMLVVAAVIYSGYNVVLEMSFADDKKLSATGLSFVREVVAVPCLYGLVRAVEKGRVRIEAGDGRTFFALACTLGAFQLCFVVGVSLTDSRTAALFQCIEPSTAAVIASMVGAERCSWAKVAAALLAGAGVAVLQSSGGSGESGSESASKSRGRYLIGCALLFCQGLGIACYCLIQKRLVDRPRKAYGPCAVTAHAYAGSLVVMAVAVSLSTAFGWEHPAPLSPAGLSALIDPRALFVVAYAAVLSSVAGYTLRAAANVVLDASVLVLYNALQPPITALLAYLILADGYGPRELAATCLVILALALAALDRRRHTYLYVFFFFFFDDDARRRFVRTPRSRRRLPSDSRRRPRSPDCHARLARRR